MMDKATARRMLLKVRGLEAEGPDLGEALEILTGEHPNPASASQDVKNLVFQVSWERLNERDCCCHGSDARRRDGRVRCGNLDEQEGWL